jgi:hypothetical protein
MRLGLELGGQFRPLLGISVSSDGGLVLDLSKYAPLGLFRYGVVDVPTAAGSHTVPPREQESGWAQGLTPKIHYHRSGELSVNATGRLSRFKVPGTPLESIRDHQHMFIYMLSEPHAWASSPVRPTDAMFKVEGVLESMKVNGFIGDIAALKEPHASHPANPFGLDVEHPDAKIVPTLIARLSVESFQYYLWLELHANPGFTGSDGPAVLLHGFDPVSAKDRSTPTATIAAWAVAETRAERILRRMKRAWRWTTAHLPGL